MRPRSAPVLSTQELDEDLGRVLNAIAVNARTGETGDGKIFVLAIENAVRVRTGEEGENAV